MRANSRRWRRKSRYLHIIYIYNIYKILYIYFFMCAQNINDNINFIFICLDGNCEAFERHHRTNNAFSLARGEWFRRWFFHFINMFIKRVWYIISYRIHPHRVIMYLFYVLLQHQQQVATAVERAKQVTMTELNAIIGVRYYIINYNIRV